MEIGDDVIVDFSNSRSFVGKISEIAEGDCIVDYYSAKHTISRDKIYPVDENFKVKTNDGQISLRYDTNAIYVKIKDEEIKLNDEEFNDLQKTMKLVFSGFCHGIEKIINELKVETV